MITVAPDDTVQLLGVVDPPFGTHALPAPLESLRRGISLLPPSRPVRWIASLLRRVCMSAQGDPFDVEPFAGQRAQLYPRDNLSEKRVFAAGQFWDADERRILGERAAQVRDRPFRFVDAGSNVGLYTLAVRSTAPRFAGLAIEPDTENLRRLRVNLAASGAADVQVAAVALGDHVGEAVLAQNHANRGELSLADTGEGLRVPVRPLLDTVREAGFDRIDALKIDIEGHETPVLSHFLTHAPRTLWPDLIVIEAPRGASTEALALLLDNGYGMLRRTRMNAVLTLPDSAKAPSPAGTGDG